MNRTLPRTNYQFALNETVPAGIRRIASEQVDRAIWQLTSDAVENRNKAVHDARKCLKKTRAILRLARESMDDELFRSESVCYRDAGRRLSAVRDSAVWVETLDKVTERFVAELPPQAFEGIREILVAKHQAICRQIFEEEDRMGEVAAVLQAARERIKNWPIELDNFVALTGGLRRIYRRGRKNLVRAYADPTPENFHDWRKQIKYLWYHMRLLRPIWTNQLGGVISELDILADLVGDHHDLVVLRQTVLDQPKLGGEEVSSLATAVDKRRLELEVEARPYGERIYVEKPGAFVKRIAAYWQIWRTDAGVR